MYKIFDLHNDYYLKLNSDGKKDKYLSKNKQVAENIISAVWTSELSCTESIDVIERARDYINSRNNVFLAVEDMHFLNKDNFDKLLSLNPIYVGLTWNTTNCLAGGVNECGRLTNFGKQVVKTLDSSNIKIDTAHLNEDSFMDLAKIASKPLFCSHTAFFGLNSHGRNLKDYQIKMIIDSGGIVGLCLVSDFLTGNSKCDVRDIVSHIDYFACKFGINNLALGTDFYGTNHLPKGVSNYSNLTSKLSKALKNLGYTEKSIEKIFYNNASNFFAV